MVLIREAYGSGKVHSVFPVLVDRSGSANLVDPSGSANPLTGSKTHSLYAGTDDEEVVLLSDRPAPTRTTGIDLADSRAFCCTRAHPGVINKMHFLPNSYLFMLLLFNVLRCSGTNGPGAAVNTSKRKLPNWLEVSAHDTQHAQPDHMHVFFGEAPIMSRFAMCHA